MFSSICLFFEVFINLKTLRMPLSGTEGELPNPLRGFRTSYKAACVLRRVTAFGSALFGLLREVGCGVRREARGILPWHLTVIPRAGWWTWWRLTRFDGGPRLLIDVTVSCRPFVVSLRTAAESAIDKGHAACLAKGRPSTRSALPHDDTLSHSYDQEP
jgi:hypothetical protein